MRQVVADSTAVIGGTASYSNPIDVTHLNVFVIAGITKDFKVALIQWFVARKSISSLTKTPQETFGCSVVLPGDVPRFRSERSKDFAIQSFYS